MFRSEVDLIHIISKYFKVRSHARCSLNPPFWSRKSTAFLARRSKGHAIGSIKGTEIL